MFKEREEETSKVYNFEYVPDENHQPCHTCDFELVVAASCHRAEIRQLGPRVCTEQERFMFKDEDI